LHLHSQTIGGNAAFNFLKLPASPLLTAAGGVNVSWQAQDAALATNNPSLYDSSLNGQLNISFNGFLAGIKTYSATFSHYIEKMETTFGAHIYYVDYGSIPQTDAAGNEMGSFRPADYVVQLSAGRKYLEKWNYGVSLKFIHSGYQQFTSAAIAVDAGIHYTDPVHLIDAGMTAKNMGVQVKTYAGEGEDLPFDLQIGVTKRLAKAPFGFSFTAQHLHRFNIVYDDTTFANDNEFSVDKGFFGKLLNHLVVAAHIYAGNNLEATIGYNHLRRSELNMGPSGNGLNGFSIGLRGKFQKLQVAYARSSYQRNISYNQLGLTLMMNQFFGTGKL
jgi:hypothetical protein